MAFPTLIYRDRPISTLYRKRFGKNDSEGLMNKYIQWSALDEISRLAQFRTTRSYLLGILKGCSGLVCSPCISLYYESD